MTLPDDAARLVDRIHSLLEHMNRDARETVHDLEGSEASELPSGLVDVAAEQARRVAELFAIDGRHRVRREPSLSGVVRAELAEVIQEACNNAGRHGQGTYCAIRGYRAGDRYVIVVRDDGVGFATGDRRTGYGLRHMREHCAVIGAHYRVWSRPGLGTVVRVSIPLPVRK